VSNESSSRYNAWTEAPPLPSKLHPSLTSDWDKLIRKVMAVLGVFSGESLSKSRTVQRLALIWQVTVAMITTGAVVFVLLTGFNDSNSFGFELMFKLSFLSWYLSCITYMWMMLYGCHSKKGFSNFYSHLDTTVEILRSVGIEIEEEPPRKQKYFVYVSVMAFLLAIAYFIVDLAVMKEGIFTGAHLDRMNISVMLITSSRVINGYCMIACSAAYMMPPAYIMNIAYSLWCILSKYNDFVGDLVKTNEVFFLRGIGQYRKIHLELCDLVVTANQPLKWILAVTTGALVLILLIVLYIIALSFSKPGLSPGFYTATSYWVILNTAILGLTIYFAQKVFNQVT